ncbi:MAG: tyrosine-protein phosphatase [Acidobacteriia bacterium]|nr:tyrosine-protein phosphatase [Terriglobia bacterium]
MIAAMPLLRSFTVALLLFCLPVGLSAWAAQSGGLTPNPERAPVPTAGRAAVQRLELPGIGNAGRAGEFLYRGAQPRESGYAQLRQLGIAIVVDLHNRGERQQRERQAVEANGMRYIGMPVSGTAGPSEEQIAAFLGLLRENAGRKFFVHCLHGADRTGVMIAAYRMSAEGWTAAQALEEMRAYHFHRLWLPAMRRTVREFPRRYESSPVFMPLRQPGPGDERGPAGRNGSTPRPL